MKLVPDQIAPWVAGGLVSLGTDSFGRSDTRDGLRSYFKVDAESIVIAVVAELCRRGRVDDVTVNRAIKELRFDVDKPTSTFTKP